MPTKTEIAQREAIRNILDKLAESHVLPLSVSFSEIVRTAAARGEYVYAGTLGKAADAVCAALAGKGIVAVRRRPPNACFIVHSRT